MTHVGIDLTSAEARVLFTQEGAMVARTEDSAEARAVMQALLGSERLERGSQAWGALDRDLVVLLKRIRSSFPDGLLLRPVIAIPSFVPSAVSDLVESAARRARLRSVQTLAAPTAGAIAYASTSKRLGTEVVAVAYMSTTMVDLGVFALPDSRIHPLALSGMPTPEPSVDDLSSKWAICDRVLKERGETITQLIVVGHAKPAILAFVRGVTGLDEAHTVRLTDAIARGALRCAEMLEWPAVLPILDDPN